MSQDTLALAETVDDGTADMSAQATFVAGDNLGATRVATVLPRIEVIDGSPTFVAPSGPRFALKEQLGAGGVGEVLRAHDEDIGRDVAIKRLLGDRQSGTAVARFVEEMRITGSLDHPNVVPVHDVGVDDDGDFFFVMRHVRGETLEDIIERLANDDPETHRRFGFERRVEIFRSILDAIAYAHSRGIIHRDIKPANIMVGPFGEVVVMDWGIAKPIRTSADLAELGSSAEIDDSEGLARAFETQADALVGTPAYMAPEQVRGQAVDERTDVYALCVLFHELLYLRHYLSDETSLVGVCHGVVNHTIPFSMSNSSKRQSVVPADLYWFVEMGMRKEPERRFQNLDAMIDRLDRRAAGEIIVQCPLTFTKRAIHEVMSFVERYPLTYLTLAAVTLLTLVGALLFSLIR